MTGLTGIASTITASFLASFVEVVEAFTIVLAVGITRGWRPAFAGTALAIAVLVLMVLVLGPLLSLVPIQSLQYIVGVLLILFGMRWLRKAILRAAGLMALNDEEKAFTMQTGLLASRKSDRRSAYMAGLTAFKAVLLEGVEVVFIVITIGAGHQMTLYASAGALAALILVLAIGLMVHRPLARVPENMLKFIVGLLLTSFGIFWTGEGLGVEWPFADLSIAAMLVVLFAFSMGTIYLLKSNAAPREATR